MDPLDKATDYCKHGNRYGAQCTLCKVPPELEHWALHKAEHEMELRDAVIEAARRALRTLRECSRVTAGGSDEEIDSLVKTVEALQELEKGDE